MPLADPTLHEHFYVHDLSPFLIEFTQEVGIRYYGLAYLFGFLGLYFGLLWQIRLGWLRMKSEDVADFITAMVIGVLVGGRLLYCVYYGWDSFLSDPLYFFKVWEGGMASHGGILGAIAAIFYYTWRKKIPFYHLADATALCTPPALFLGRIANFINGELWGRPTTVSWGVIFPDAPKQLVASLPEDVRSDLVQNYGIDLLTVIDIPRHPSQLYEAALEGALLFVILLGIRYLTRRDAFVALGFVGGYAVLRIIGENYREPDAQIGYLFGGWTAGQLFSVAQVALAIVLAVVEYRRQNRRSGKSS